MATSFSYSLPAGLFQEGSDEEATRLSMPFVQIETGSEEGLKLKVGSISECVRNCTIETLKIDKNIKLYNYGEACLILR